MQDDEYRALQEQAHLIETLTRSPGWEVLVDYWMAVTKNAKHAVLNGNVTDFEKYKSVTGELIGIHKVLDTPKTLTTMVESEAERRRLRGLESE